MHRVDQSNRDLVAMRELSVGFKSATRGHGENRSQNEAVYKAICVPPVSFFTLSLRVHPLNFLPRETCSCGDPANREKTKLSRELNLPVRRTFRSPLYLCSRIPRHNSGPSSVPLAFSVMNRSKSTETNGVDESRQGLSLTDKSNVSSRTFTEV